MPSFNSNKNKKKSNDLISITINSNDICWQDREIRFDSDGIEMKCRRGESIIDSINSVEDTKGNNGLRGALIVTNLRLMWVSHRNVFTNLSIGFGSVLQITIKTAQSRLRGKTQALYVMCKHQGSRFEFVFTSLVKNSPRMFTTVQAVLRAYETSKLYRDLKLRGSIIKDMQLNLLPQEEIFNRIEGVWNLSTDQGNLGTFFITNVRLVWHANLAQNFNVSIPYMQMKKICLRDSKFGVALVVETNPKGQGYILGFRIDPQEKLEEVYQEIQSLYRIYSSNPIFGIEYDIEDVPKTLDQLRAERIDEDVEIISTENQTDAFVAYFAELSKAGDREIVYNESLGLAIEALPGETTIEQLFQLN